MGKSTLKYPASWQRERLLSRHPGTSLLLVCPQIKQGRKHHTLQITTELSRSSQFFFLFAKNSKGAVSGFKHRKLVYNIPAPPPQKITLRKGCQWFGWETAPCLLRGTHEQVSSPTSMVCWDPRGHTQRRVWNWRRQPRAERQHSFPNLVTQTQLHPALHRLHLCAPPQLRPFLIQFLVLWEPPAIKLFHHYFMILLLLWIEM